MQNCNSLFSQRAGGQGHFKVVLTIRRGCFQRIPGLVWACKACEHQVCYPESIVICFLLCHVCQGDICERLSWMSNVKEIKDSLCVRKFTWLAQYSLLHPTIGKCSMFDRNHRPEPRLILLRLHLSSDPREISGLNNNVWGWDEIIQLIKI